MNFEKIYELELTNEELIEITGEYDLKTQDIPSSLDKIIRPSSFSCKDTFINNYRRKKYSFYLSILFFITVALSGIISFIGILFFTDKDQTTSEYNLYFVLSIVSPMIMYLFLGRYVVKMFFVIPPKKIAEIKKLEPTILGCLLDQTDKYNTAVKKIIVAKKLLDAGNKINSENLEQTANVYFNIRKDIVRALETERILRENPDYRTSVNIKSPEPIKNLHIQDIEYEELTHEAIRINNEIEQQLKILAIRI